MTHSKPTSKKFAQEVHMDYENAHHLNIKADELV